MKIAIDVSQILFETGVSTYTGNLVKSLLKIDQINHYILFGGSLRRYTELKEKLIEFKFTNNNNFLIKTYPFSPSFLDLIWNRLHIIPVEKLVGFVDVFHSSDWTQPPTSAYKVTTVHDVVPLKYPRLSQKLIVDVHKRRFELIKRHADAIIAPSESTKADLISLGIPENKIYVIPEAPDPLIKPAKANVIEAIKRKYKISGNYLLAIGVTPRKNVDRIIESYEAIKPTHKLKLVIIGRIGTDVEPKRGVMYLGHVPKEDIPILLSGSEVLVYPSLYEGFGLPILEAFACNTPVVTTNYGSTKEIAGESALLVDPYSTEMIKEGILKALSTKKELVKKGQNRVKSFTWTRSAQKTLEVYKKASIGIK